MSAPAERPVGLVTGGARGIGLALVETWAARGVAVAAVDRNPEGAATIAEVCRGAGVACSYYEADIREFARAEAIVRDIVQRLGRLDYVVLNAGITRDRMSWRMTEAEWNDVLSINLTGAFAYARAAAPVLRARRSGAIVFVSSVNALRGKVGQANYAASKAGMIGLARTLALELGPAGINVNVVAPGLTRTSMSEALPAEVVERARSESPLGRIAEPSDIAAAIDFLCQPAARHITGAVLRVDGGQAMTATPVEEAAWT